MLRPQDIEELDRREHHYVVSEGPGETLVIVKDFPLPEGLLPRSVELLVRVPSLYPAVHPDMFWMVPAAVKWNGTAIPATQVTENILDRQWQRWSRHLQPSEWRPDRDDIGTYLDIVGFCLKVAAA